MTNDRFEALVKEIRSKSIDTMLKKNAGYATKDDRLHNFRVGAAMIGGTPAQAALGYMAKHLASLVDKVQSNDFHDREDFLEKVQDSINYLVFIWCCGNEEMDKYTKCVCAEELAKPTITESNRISLTNPKVEVDLFTGRPHTLPDLPLGCPGVTNPDGTKDFW